ncbi:glycosyltransferase family 2 protein [Winogradskyella sp. PAMC22761]|nr:glycosyltransferase family 2 protein [Winogradskyella sp. PAMC22761]
MQNEPLISVCIPVYNREKFIKAALKSVLNQTYQNFEIIVVDDGSSDNSVTIIKSIKDTRIKLFKNAVNKGVVFTRNVGLEKASGDFIAVLDSDDTWEANKLQKQIDFFKVNPDYGICGTWAKREYVDGNTDEWKYPISDSEIRARLVWGSAMIHSSVMFRKRVLEANNFSYDNTIKQAEDYDLIRQFVKNTKAHNIEETLVTYAVHENQFTSEAKDEQVTEAVKVAFRYLNDLGVKLSENEASAFENVFAYDFKMSIDELKYFEQVLDKIFSRIQKDVDSKEYFQYHLFNYWFLVCYSNSQKGFKVFSLYFKNKKLKLNPTLSLKHLKFFIKCLLRKK